MVLWVGVRRTRVILVLDKLLLCQQLTLQLHPGLLASRTRSRVLCDKEGRLHLTHVTIARTCRQVCSRSTCATRTDKTW